MKLPLEPQVRRITVTECAKSGDREPLPSSCRGTIQIWPTMLSLLLAVNCLVWTCESSRRKIFRKRLASLARISVADRDKMSGAVLCRVVDSHRSHGPTRTFNTVSESCTERTMKWSGQQDIFKSFVC